VKAQLAELRLYGIIGAVEPSGYFKGLCPGKEPRYKLNLIIRWALSAIIGLSWQGSGGRRDFRFVIYDCRKGRTEGESTANSEHSTFNAEQVRFDREDGFSIYDCRFGLGCATRGGQVSRRARARWPC